MKHSVIKVLALVLCLVYCVRMSAAEPKSKTVFPSWIRTQSANQFIGVSMPNKNPQLARKQAVAAAVMQYSMNTGGAICKIKCEKHVSNAASEEGARPLSKFEIGKTLIVKGFSMNISQEYYNDRGECFVLCEFQKNEQSENEVNCMFVGVFDEKDAFETTTDITANVVLDVEGIKGELETILVHDGSQYEKKIVKIDGKVVNDKKLSYPNISVGLNSASEGCTDVLSTSLGFSQLCMTMCMPCFPESYDIISDIKAEKEKFTADYHMKSLGKTVPVDFRWKGIIKGKSIYSTLAELPSSLKPEDKDYYSDFAYVGDEKYNLMTSSPAIYDCMIHLYDQMKPEEKRNDFVKSGDNVPDEPFSLLIKTKCNVSRVQFMKTDDLPPHFTICTKDKIVN